MSNKTKGKSNITVMSVDSSNDKTMLNMDAPPTEAQEMNTIIDEIKANEHEHEQDVKQEVKQEVKQDQEPVMNEPVKKRRSKSTPKAKPVEVLQSVDENKTAVVQSDDELKPVKKPRAKPKAKPIEVVESVDEVKQVKPAPKKAEQVECPNCKKMMTAKTLKYNHSHNCPATKFKNEPPKQEHPTQEQPKREEPKEEEQNIQDKLSEIVPKLTHREIKKRRHQQSIAKLATQIL